MQKHIEELCVVIMTGGKSSRMGGGIKSLEKFNITLFPGSRQLEVDRHMPLFINICKKLIDHK